MVPDDLTNISANLSQAQQNSVMAHRILVKFKEMDLPEELDKELSKLCTDLGDMWSAQMVFTEKLSELLEVEMDWAMAGDYLADIKSQIDHIAWHVESVMDPIIKIAEYAYGADN
jgi:hypothetical protein